MDRESAFEKLKGSQASAKSAPPLIGALEEKKGGFFSSLFRGGDSSTPARGRGRASDSLAEMMAKSAVRTIGSSVGREIVRGVLGSIFGGRKRR